jgi:hypothetical protein
VVLAVQIENPLAIFDKLLVLLHLLPSPNFEGTHAISFLIFFLLAFFFFGIVLSQLPIRHSRFN